MSNEQGKKPAAQGSTASGQPSEIESLRAVVEAQGKQITLLTQKIESLSYAPPQAVAAAVAPVVLPAAELRRQQDAANRKADDEARRANTEKAERQLREGPNQFRVSLRGNPTRVVGGTDAVQAKDKYCRYYGIIRPGGEVIAEPVSASAAA